MVGLIICIVIVFAIVGYIYDSRRSQSILQDWAGRNGYRILDQKTVQWVFNSPFSWTPTVTYIYRVVVEDQGRCTRRGWVRCGSPWLGLWSTKVEVRWDECGKNAQ
jgi:hypothetical protein